MGHCGPVMRIQARLGHGSSYDRAHTMEWIEQSLSDIERYLEAYISNQEAADTERKSALEATGTGVSGLKF